SLFTGLAAALLLLEGALYAYHTGSLYPQSAIPWLGLVVSVLICPFLWIGAYQAAGATRPPAAPTGRPALDFRRLDLAQFRIPARRRGIAARLAVYLPVGAIVAGVIFQLVRPEARWVGTATGLAIGASYVLATSAARAPTATAGPRWLIAQNLRYELVAVLLPGLAVEGI